jgi:hypothetical protein
MTHGEIHRPVAGRALGKHVLDQGRQRHPHAEPRYALRDDEPSDVVRRQKRKRADAAADQCAACDNPRLHVAAHEETCERGYRHERHRERRRKRAHRPADNEQQHDAEEERRQGTRDEPEDDNRPRLGPRQARRERRRFGPCPPEDGGDERNRGLRDEDRAPRERLR